MIQLTKGNTEYIYLTLTEKQILTAPNYLFIFKNRGSNNEVAFVKLNNTDVSVYKERYNKFQIVVNTYFNTSTTGVWEYYCYEQASSTNLNPNGLNLLESGIMMLLNPANVFTEYSTTDTYKIRQ